LIPHMKAFVLDVLHHAHEREWSVQGFGMLRTYIGGDKRFRLNVWHSEFAVPNVSIIHNHPWNFRSWIMTGRFTNVRFQLGVGQPYQAMEIEPGDQGGATGMPSTCIMSEMPPEDYFPGDTYEQAWNEVHASFYKDGTVTLNDRTGGPTGRDARAMVYWRDGDWVDAKPRPATRDEVAFAASEALGRFR